jgi:zinc/manganese transport system ATP-binding protein
VIEFQNVSLSLGGRLILSAISLEIGSNEFVGILGPNGAGKTTLMRAVLGLIAPAQGSIRILGQPARRGNPLIGYMPQARTAMAGLRLNCWEFVASVINGHRIGLPVLGQADRREVDRVLDLVGATALARRPLAETSGGERQRVLLAQALVNGPKLLLLDEPLISLDPHHQRNVIELVKTVQTELGISVLLSAHELNPLLGALDRVMYLARGKVAIGSIDDVITGPVLSRLYGSDIDVVRLNGRIFVMSGSHDLETDQHMHERDGNHHA